MKNVALITGVTGQDGSYLTESLLAKGYEVHGIKRRASSFNTARLDHIPLAPPFYLHYGDVTDTTNLIRLLKEIQPTEVYNLAAQSHVQVSFDTPEYTAQSDALGPMRLLEGIRLLGLDTRFYQAATSEMYGNVPTPMSEDTPFHPRSPYGAAKLYGYWITRNYREAYGMHASSGILFNHESPRRGHTFVTRKITQACAASLRNPQPPLRLGNLDAKRDWGHARDYAEAMWVMLQQDKPDDYVIATGETHSVREFVERAFAHVGTAIEWRGTGVDEIGYRAGTDEKVVCVDPHYFRPSEIDVLLGDPTKAREKLGWTPTVTFPELVREMVMADVDGGW